jgi:formate dehydrogenase maturation protein FdhE
MQHGEWGYINVPELIQAGNRLKYVEQDLYFEDMYIDSSGSVGKKQELENKIHCPNCGKWRSIEVHETIDGLHYCSCIDCEHSFTKPANSAA